MEKLQTEKCQAIMKATLELVAEQGFHGTPISQIAARAGVGVGSIYRYFSDKDALIHAVHAQLELGLHPALAEGLDWNGSTEDKFICLITNLIRHLMDNPLEFKFLEQYFNSPYGIEKMREKFLDEPLGDADTCTPFMNILFEQRGKAIKDLPKPVIHALAFGPAVFLVRDHLAGLVHLDAELIRKAVLACWDAIHN